MTAHVPASVEAAADWLRKQFDRDAARDIEVRYELELGGAEGGVIAVAIADGRIDVRTQPGSIPPDARFRLAARDFFGILGGTENAELLAMAGRIQVEGELSLAMRFRGFFARRV